MRSIQSAQAQAQIKALGLGCAVGAAVVRPAGAGERVQIADWLHPALQAGLQELGYSLLYPHQVEAAEAAEAEEDVVITTPTASGKSLGFTLPALHAALADRTRSFRTLYLAPTKALIGDQAAKLRDWTQVLAGAGVDLRTAVLTGDTPGDRALLFQPAPELLLTNPDCLNALLFKQGYSMFTGLKLFLKQLRYVVLDEAHAYTGIFGGNVANLLRRLRLAVARAGGDPDQVQFILATATVANPQQVWQTLCSRTSEHPVALIDRSGAPFPGRTEIYTNGKVSGKAGVCRLINRLLEQGLTTIVFVQSRNIGRELLHTMQRELKRLGQDPGVIAQFHGTVAAHRRQAVVEQIQRGAVQVVIATSALEQGVDFPQIDAALCWGFPGVNQLRQRFGRAGRGQKPGLGIYVPTLHIAEDWYYARHGEELANASADAVLLNPDYAPRLKPHILAAAGESGVRVRPDLCELFGDAGAGAAHSLLQEGRLSVVNGWLTADRKAALGIAMRGQKQHPVHLVEQETGDVIEEFSYSLALREAHPGAIYSGHGGTGEFRKWRVRSLDLEAGLAKAVAINPDSGFSTRAELNLLVEPDESVPVEQRCLDLGIGTVLLELGWGTVTQQVLGYDEQLITNRVACFQEDCAAYNQPLPQRQGTCNHCGGPLLLASAQTETVDSVRFENPLSESYNAPILTLRCSRELDEALNRLAEELVQRLSEEQGELPPQHQDLVMTPHGLLGLHSLSHLLLNCLPLVSQPIAASDLVAFNAAAGGNVVLFDTVEGGTGSVEYLFQEAEHLLGQAYHLAAECDCQTGCPKCCHCRQCSAGNEVLHRPLIQSLLEQMQKA